MELCPVHSFGRLGQPGVLNKVPVVGQKEAKPLQKLHVKILNSECIFHLRVLKIAKKSGKFIVSTSELANF